MEYKNNEQNSVIFSIAEILSKMSNQVGFLIRNNKLMSQLDVDMLMENTRKLYDTICSVRCNMDADSIPMEVENEEKPVIKSEDLKIESDELATEEMEEDDEMFAFELGEDSDEDDMGDMDVDSDEDVDIVEEPDTDDLNAETLLSFVRQLPPGYRAVFNLFVIEEKSHKEIAEILHIKPVTSASQFARARQMLAKMIRTYKHKTEDR